MHMLRVYNTYTDKLFCQGHDSAPGLNIMLLKQRHFSVYGQAADQARQHPPVEYVYRSSHPLLQFLPQKLAEWIANNYAAQRDDNHDIAQSLFYLDSMWFVRPQLFFNCMLRPIGTAAGRFTCSESSDEDIQLDLVFSSPFEELHLRTAGIME
jgi:hypothetical protein